MTERETLHPLLKRGEGVTEALERQAAEIERLTAEGIELRNWHAKNSETIERLQAALIAVNAARQLQVAQEIARRALKAPASAGVKS